MIKLSKILPALIVLSLFLSPLSAAEKWQYQAVLTQGMSLTDENNFYGDSQDSPSFEFTEISASGSYQFHRSSRLSGQALYRHAGAIEDISVDYLVLDTQYYSSEQALYGFRLGRYKLPFGLYNETRDVAFARQAVLLPQSLYSDSQRDLRIAADGLLLYASMFSQYGQWDIDLSYGKLNLDNISGYPGFPKGGSFSDEYAAVGRILFESFDGSFRAAISVINATVNYQFDLRDFDETLDQGMAQLDALIQQLNPGVETLPITIPTGGDIEEQQIIASFEYSWEKITFSTEYRLTFTKTLFPSVTIPTLVDPMDPTAGLTTFSQEIPNLDLDGEAYYLQGKYIFNPQWSAYLRWDVVYDNKDDKNGDGVLNTPNYSVYAKDFTVGGIWNINPQIMLAAELHQIKGTQWLSTIDNPDPFDTKEKWKLFVMTLSYRF
ncbi:MAG: hypothetical protein HRU20_20040 [Pseudomonadales bacterium]|nr:hypothetical protein [Pseudomonadales bacterium]